MMSHVHAALAPKIVTSGVCVTPITSLDDCTTASMLLPLSGLGPATGDEGTQGVGRVLLYEDVNSI